MTITEAKRLELHQDLRNTIGVEAADTLMEHLPPTGWADVVRRSDLDNHTSTTSSEIERSRLELMAHMDNRLAAQTRWIVTLTSANTLAMAGLIVAVLLKL